MLEKIDINLFNIAASDFIGRTKNKDKALKFIATTRNDFSEAGLNKLSQHKYSQAQVDEVVKLLILNYEVL
jgi:hypothetical protein